MAKTIIEEGKTYSGSLTMQNMLNLKLEGCVLALFCRSEIWKRTNSGQM